MDGLEQTYGTRLRVLRTNFDSPQGQELARRYQVRSHPQLLLIDSGGSVRASFLGVPERNEVEQAIVALLGPVTR